MGPNHLQMARTELRGRKEAPVQIWGEKFSFTHTFIL